MIISIVKCGSADICLDGPEADLYSSDNPFGLFNSGCAARTTSTRQRQIRTGYVVIAVSYAALDGRLLGPARLASCTTKIDAVENAASVCRTK
jgi:hypothetical protein